MQGFEHLDETLPPDRDDQDTMDTLETSIGGESPIPSTPSHPFISQGKADAVPEQIGPYKITGIIGSGGMGTVYEATQEQPKRRVALKVVKSGQASESAKRRFSFEVQTLAKLQHRGIAGVYEAGIYTGSGHEQPYFAMEYIPGARPLTEYAKEENLDVKARLDLFMQICDAIHHGHQKGIIHRDLKPDNILVDRDGNPKIIDFGIARATDADIAVTTMQTSVGQILGTLQYMSPEQCLGDPDLIDTRADVYSLGVIFYELLCDELPYDVSKQALVEAVRIIREEKPSRPSTITKFVRGDLETISMKALEKTSARRYDSAASFKRDIERYLNREPIEARPPSLAYQVSMFTKRHRFTAVAASVTLVAIIGGLIATSIAWVHAAEQTRIAIEQRGIAETQKSEADRQRIVADEQRDLANSRADDIARQAEELEALVEFQADQLSSIDIPAMSGDLRDRMVDMLGLTNEAVGGVDFTGATLGLLKSYYFTPTVENASEELQDQPLVLARLLDTVGHAHLELGDPNDATELLQRAYELRLGELDPGDLPVAKSLYKLGVLNKLLGSSEPAKLDLALDYFDQAVDAFVDLGMDDTTIYFDGLKSIADVHNMAGRYAISLELYRDAFELAETKLPPDHRATLSLMESLADMLLAHGNNSEALELAEKNVEAHLRKYGPDHRETVTARKTLSNCLSQMGRAKEAIPTQIEIVEFYKRELGNYHLSTLVAINDLGASHYYNDDYAAAAECFKQAMESNEVIYGKTHGETLNSRRNYGIALRALGDLEAALELQLETSELLRVISGDDHPTYISSLYSIGLIYRDMERYVESLAYHEDAMRRGLDVLGTDYPQNFDFILAVALAHVRLEQDVEAEPLFVQSLEGKRRIYGDRHWETIDPLLYLSELCLRQERREEAIRFGREAYDNHRLRAEPSPSKELRLSRHLCAVLAGTTRYSEAATICRECLTLGKRVDSSDAPEVAADLETLATLYDRWHESEPEVGHDASAAAFRDQLAQIDVP